MRPIRTITIVALAVLTLLATPAFGDAATTVRVSRTSTGGDIDGASFTGGGALSDDGRFVAFTSFANGVVPGDTAMCPTLGTPPERPCEDVFLLDRQSGSLEMISVSYDGLQRVGHSVIGGISADGRFVAFSSTADDLVAGDNNGRQDVFVRDRATGVTTRVSDSFVDGQAGFPRISADGEVVAFDVYDSGTYVDEVYAYDFATGVTQLVSARPDGQPAGAYSAYTDISGNGRYVTFSSTAENLTAGDLNGKTDVFVRDLVTDTTTLVSVRDNGRQLDTDSYYPSISYDGGVVAFSTAGDVYVRDIPASRTELVSVNRLGLRARGFSETPAVSDDGRYVLFASTAGGMTKDDRLLSVFRDEPFLQMYVRDRSLGENERVSVNDAGERANQATFLGAISGNGAVVGFNTSATNLDPSDANDNLDVYLRLRG
jgi:Tol biopolymer transport system component